MMINFTHHIFGLALGVWRRVSDYGDVDDSEKCIAHTKLQGMPKGIFRFGGKTVFAALFFFVLFSRILMFVGFHRTHSPLHSPLFWLILSVVVVVLIVLFIFVIAVNRLYSENPIKYIQHFSGTRSRVLTHTHSYPPTLTHSHIHTFSNFMRID